MFLEACSLPRAQVGFPEGANLVLHVTPDRRRGTVVVMPGKDHLIVRSTGYHALVHIAAAFAPNRGPDCDVAVRRLVDSIMRANGLNSDRAFAGNLEIPLPAAGASLDLILATAVQKAVMLDPEDEHGPLDFMKIGFRQRRNCESYLVEIPRWCSHETAGFLVRRLPGAPNRIPFEVRF